MCIQGLCGYPIANIPYLTSPLLKFHGKIVTLFSQFEPMKNRLWELIKRIGFVFSCLFVYPALAILTLAGCIYAKFSVKPVPTNPLHNLINEEIKSAKDRFSSVDLKNNYWWFIEMDLHPVKGPLALSDFHGSYKYVKANVASSHEDCKQFLTVERFMQDTLSFINPNKFEIKFKFIVVEKGSEEKFNLYSYDQEINYVGKTQKSGGGLQSNTSVSIDAARSFLKDSFQVACPFGEI